MTTYFRSPPLPYRWYLPSGVTWRIPDHSERTVYLTFDDGPDAMVTPAVLDILANRGASATFFCTGEHLDAQPCLHGRIRSEGHALANHGYRHLDGWRMGATAYAENVRQGAEVSGSHLFRPPYGRITRTQAHLLSPDTRVVLWSLLSGDFDGRRNAAGCLETLERRTRPGDIVVFHDSIASGPRTLEILPRYLDFLHRGSYLLEILR